jgi:hypothetical protein
LEHDVAHAQRAGELDPERPTSELTFTLQAILIGAHWSARARRDPDAFAHAHAAIDGVLGAGAARN